MASKIVNVRFPEALLAQVDAEAERTGRSRSEVILEDVAAGRAGYREEPPPTATQRPAPRAAPQTPRAEAAREAARAAEEKTGVAVTSGSSRVREATARAGTMEWDPNAKRMPYQKGRTGAGKGRR